ncbi:MAG: thioredoxin [Evtepia sp.]
MSVQVITTKDFNTEVLQSDKPVLIDFWAGWCGPCRMLSPVVDELAAEVDSVKFCKVNVDEEPELAAKFRVMSIPMLVLMKDGKIVSQSVGVKPKEAVREMLLK